MIFVDTSAIYALASERDSRHREARRSFKTLLQTERPLVTHSYVVAESMALLHHRLGRNVALTFAFEARGFEDARAKARPLQFWRERKQVGLTADDQNVVHTPKYRQRVHSGIRLRVTGGLRVLRRGLDDGGHAPHAELHQWVGAVRVNLLLLQQALVLRPRHQDRLPLAVDDGGDAEGLLSRVAEDVSEHADDVLVGVAVVVEQDEMAGLLELLVHLGLLDDLGEAGGGHEGTVASVGGARQGGGAVTWGFGIR